MKLWQTNGNGVCCVEIAYDWLKARYQGRLLELRLDRRQDFTLEPNSRQAAAHELQVFLHRSALQPRPRVLCAIPARGVSLRRLTIPVTSEDERHKVLQLQLEAELPLAPEDLAWGYQRVNGASQRQAGKEEVLVAAVRREVLRDYAELFEGSSSNVVFTPAGVARALACPHVVGAFAHLELGSKHAELVTVEDGIPSALRVVQPMEPVGEERGAELALPGGRLWTGAASAGTDTAPTAGPVAALDVLKSSGRPSVRKLFVGPARNGAFSESELSRRFNASVEVLDPLTAAGATLAIAGLEITVRQGLPLPQLATTSGSKPRTGAAGTTVSVRWAVAATVLVILALLFPYIAAAVHKPYLARKLAGIKVDRSRLAMIDSELEFLKHLKQSQAPILDTIYLISRSAPPGTRFDLLALTRKGELSIKGTFRDPTQIADFRGKLLDTGFFSGIAIEEQTPSPDRQKFTVRMTATYKTDQLRETATALAAKEPDKPKSSLMMGGGAGPMGMPMGMPPMGMPSGPPMGPGGMVMPSGMPGAPPGAVSLPPGAMPPGVSLPPGVRVFPGQAPPPGAMPVVPGPMPTPTPNP